MSLKHTLLFLLSFPALAHAETGANMWLRYAPPDAATARRLQDAAPAVVTAFGDAPTIVSARDEVIRGIRGMLGRTPRVESRIPAESAIILGAVADIRRAAPQLSLPST